MIEMLADRAGARLPIVYPEYILDLELYPLQEFDLRVYESTPAHWALGAILLLILFVGMTYVLYRNAYRGLSEEQKRVKATVTGARYDQNPRTLRIPAEEDIFEYRGKIKRLFDREAVSPEVETPSLRGALLEVRSALSEAWDPLRDRVPLVSLRLIQLATTTLIFGSIAVSTDWVLRQLETDGEIHFGAILEDLIAVTRDAIELLIDVLATFPFIGEFLSFVLAYGLLLYEIIYQNWYETAIALLAIAIVLIVIDQIVSERIETRLYHDKLATAGRLVAGIGTIWLGGVVPTAIGQRVGRGELGTRIGLVIAGLLVVGLVGLGVVGLAERIRRVRDLYPTASRIALSYYVVTRVAGVIGLAILPIVPVWIAVGVASGSLFTVAEAVLASELEVKVSIGLIAMVAIAIFVYGVRSSYPEIKAALRESLARKKVRTALFYRGVSGVFVLIGYTVGWGFLDSVILAIPVAIATGLLATLSIGLLYRARYHVSMFERSERLPARVLIQAYRIKLPLEDDSETGETVYYAYLNDTAIASPDREEIVDLCLNKGRELLETGEIKPCVATWYARDLFDYGIQDPRETAQRLTEKIRERLYHSLRQNDQFIERAALERDLADYPEDMIEERLYDYRVRKGLIRQRNGYLELVRDPLGDD